MAKYTYQYDLSGNRTHVQERLAYPPTVFLPSVIADSEGGEASQRITQDQLAARLGTVREVVARSLRELEHKGAIKVKRG